MKKIIVLLFVLCSFARGYGQTSERDQQALFNIQKTSAARACSCIDSINDKNKSRQQVTEEVRTCIKKQIQGYVSSLTILKSFSAMYKMMEQTNDSTSKQAVPVMAPTQSELRQYFYDIERFMYYDCREIRRKIRAEEIDNRLEVADNPESFALYTQAQAELKAGKYQKSIENCEKALAIDPNFAFAWNTIAESYKKEGDFDKTINACNQSMKIDPFSMIPHLMKASACREMKQYDNAIDAYKMLVHLVPYKPEPFYEFGKFYFEVLQDAEKGLENMCTAYSLYSSDSPPINIDIEKNIRLMYTELKNAGKDVLADKILKDRKVPSRVKP